MHLPKFIRESFIYKAVFNTFWIPFFLVVVSFLFGMWTLWEYTIPSSTWKTNIQKPADLLWKVLMWPPMMHLMVIAVLLFVIILIACVQYLHSEFERSKKDFIRSNDFQKDKADINKTLEIAWILTRYNFLIKRMGELEFAMGRLKGAWSRIGEAARDPNLTPNMNNTRMWRGWNEAEMAMSSSQRELETLLKYFKNEIGNHSKYDPDSRAPDEASIENQEKRIMYRKAYYNYDILKSESEKLYNVIRKEITSIESIIYGYMCDNRSEEIIDKLKRH